VSPRVSNTSFRRTSIFKLLRNSVGMLSAFALVSVIVSVFAINVIKRSVNLFAGTSFPVSTIAVDIKLQSQFISDTLPALSSVDGREALDQAVYDLMLATHAVKTYVQRVAEIDSERKFSFFLTTSSSLTSLVQLIESQRLALEGKLLAVQHANEARHVLSTKIRTVVRDLDLAIVQREFDGLKIENKIRSSQDIRLVDELVLSNYVLQDLRALKSSVDNLEVFLAQAESATSYGQLQRSLNEFGSVLRTSSATIASLGEGVGKSSIAKGLTEVYQGHNSSDGYFESRKAYFTKLEDVTLNNDKIVLLLENINVDVDKSLVAVAQFNASVVSDILKNTEASLVVLLLIAAIVILAYVFVLYRVVLTRIVFPLKLASQAIVQLGKGADSYTSFDTSARELQQIDQALHTFLKNSVELQRREVELLDKNHQLDRSNESLRMFMRVSSHDLKSPLRGVRLLCTMLRENLVESDLDSAEFNLERMDNRILRLERLLDSLLEYTRVGEVGSISIVNIDQLIREQFDLLDQSHLFQLHISSAIKTFSTCETPLAMVVRNLLDNAMKHHDRERGNLRVSVASGREGFYEISVADDGPGVEGAYHERIFRPFETLKPKDEVEGSGIGLAMITKLLDRLGGCVTVDSPLQNGRGAAFIVTWPCAVEHLLNHEV